MIPHHWLETLMNFPFFFFFSFSKLVAPCIDRTIRPLLGNRCCSQRAVKVSSMKEISHGFEVISYFASLSLFFSSNSPLSLLRTYLKILLILLSRNFILTRGSSEMRYNENRKIRFFLIEIISQVRTKGWTDVRVRIIRRILISLIRSSLILSL